MGRARALVFAAEEDFGIVPVEAQACGTPVIAYGRGGIEDTIIPASGNNWGQATGILFSEQTVVSLIEAIRQFERWELNFQAGVLRHHAESFGRERFKKQVSDYVSEKWRQHEAKSELEKGVQ